MATLMKCGSIIQVILYYVKEIKCLSYFHIRTCEIHASPNQVSPSNWTLYHRYCIHRLDFCASQAQLCVTWEQMHYGLRHGYRDSKRTINPGLIGKNRRRDFPHSFSHTLKMLHIFILRYWHAYLLGKTKRRVTRKTTAKTTNRLSHVVFQPAQLNILADCEHDRKKANALK